MLDLSGGSGRLNPQIKQVVKPYEKMRFVPPQLTPPHDQ
jgi:hypothetical protein